MLANAKISVGQNNQQGLIALVEDWGFESLPKSANPTAHVIASHSGD